MHTTKYLRAAALALVAVAALPSMAQAQYYGQYHHNDPRDRYRAQKMYQAQQIRDARYLNAQRPYSPYAPVAPLYRQPVAPVYNNAYNPGYTPGRERKVDRVANGQQMQLYSGLATGQLSKKDYNKLQEQQANLAAMTAVMKQTNGGLDRNEANLIRATQQQMQNNIFKKMD